MIDVQEKLGLDVLVHGEFERSDMVEFFGQKMKGFAFTKKMVGFNHMGQDVCARR